GSCCNYAFHAFEYGLGSPEATSSEDGSLFARGVCQGFVGLRGWNAALRPGLKASTKCKDKQECQSTQRVGKHTKHKTSRNRRVSCDETLESPLRLQRLYRIPPFALSPPPSWQFGVADAISAFLGGVPIVRVPAAGAAPTSFSGFTR